MSLPSPCGGASASAPHRETGAAAGQAGAAESTSLGGLEQVFAADNQVFAQSAAANGQPNAATHETGTTARILLRYDYRGQPEDEILSVTAILTDAPIAVAGTGAYGIVQTRMARAQYTDTTVRASRAPAGLLDAAIPLLDQIRGHADQGI